MWRVHDGYRQVRGAFMSRSVGSPLHPNSSQERHRQKKETDCEESDFHSNSKRSYCSDPRSQSALPVLGDRQNKTYRRLGPMSRPLIRSGQWSQTTTRLACRLNHHPARLANKPLRSVLHKCLIRLEEALDFSIGCTFLESAAIIEIQAG